MNESDLLQHVYATAGEARGDVIIAPGDDMAMIAFAGDRLLAAVDQIVDGRHVRLENTPPELVGRKAITRCLSDVAAMAARPVASLAAATLPHDLETSYVNSMFDAMHATAKAYACPLIGGDIAIHRVDAPLTCSVTVMARPGPSPVIRRGGGRPGDALYVTGRLGGSLDENGLGAHLDFEPRIDEALALAAALGDRLHAMIDLSDGLGRDASHLASMAGLRIDVDLAALPCNTGVSPHRAASDGEDYELCFLASGDVPAEIAGLEVARIGEARAAGSDEACVFFHDGGRVARGDTAGWEHRS